MKVLGVDPSSSCTGLALIDDGKIIVTDHWIPKDGSAPERLVQYYKWLNMWIGMWSPDIAVIEYLSVERNAQATRIISHYQAISALSCKMNSMMIVEARATSARKVVLGKGNLSKKETFELIKKRFPDHKFGRWEKPGADETDACVLALGGLSLAER